MVKFEHYTYMASCAGSRVCRVSTCGGASGCRPRLGCRRAATTAQCTPAACTAPATRSCVNSPCAASAGPVCHWSGCNWEDLSLSFMNRDLCYLHFTFFARNVHSATVWLFPIVWADHHFHRWDAWPALCSIFESGPSNLPVVFKSSQDTLSYW